MGSAFRNFTNSKKGFIFSFDAAFAVFILAIGLITIGYFSYQAEKSQYAKLQLERIGKDALAVLDADGTLQSGNRTLIEQRLNQSLPAGMGWRINMRTYYKETAAFNMIDAAEYGQDAPTGRDVYEIRRDFASIESRVMNYSIARMKIWKN